MKYNNSSSNSSNSSNNNKRANGYTLIELMVVLSVLSILTITSLEGLFRSKANMDLNRAAYQLEAILKDCQSKAMYTGNYYKIDFYPSINRYRVYRYNETYNGTIKELVQDVQLGNINLHNANFTDSKVGFTKNGTPSMGGTVTLKNKYGKTLYVIMTPVTARTRVSTKPPANW
jgi:prepilin-type N-terminal cleavage/methylation domain-containing protein